MTDFDRISAMIECSNLNYETDSPFLDEEDGISISGFIHVWLLTDRGFRLDFNPDGSFKKIFIND